MSLGMQFDLFVTGRVGFLWKIDDSLYNYLFNLVGSR